MAEHTPRILIVDDTFTTRLIFRKQLEAAGYVDVEDASDGDVALQALLRGLDGGKPFRLVISDWAMPKMSGYDLLRTVRSTPGLEETPFLMVTSTADRDRILMAVKAGVSDFVVKPIDVAAFREKVESILGGSGKQAGPPSNPPRG